MKKIALVSLAILCIGATEAQQKTGKVTYERTMQMQINFPGMNPEMERLIPRSRTEKYELIFSNNQSLWKAAEQENDEEGFAGGETGGIQIRMVGSSPNDVSFTDFSNSKRVEQRELFDKKFIVDDSIRPLKWKMAGETRTILNHNCMKATTTQVNQRMQMTMTDGKMERKEVPDTLQIIAWFATDIPVPAGPAEFQGQLPGLILEMDVNNGRQVYKATSISEKADLAVIKEPSGKKHYTAEEFRKERDKMMAEMQRNGPPGGGGMQRVIRMN